MKKLVFTIRDDVCAANGKDPAATELLNKMELWGDVEDFESVVTGVRAEYQTSINNLTAHIAAIKAQELTSDEMALIATYRKCKTEVTEEFKVRINELEVTLADIKAEEEKRIETIIAMLRGNG